MKEKTTQRISDDGKYCYTEYGQEDGCGGCKANGLMSLACDNCYDKKTGIYTNFQPDINVYKIK